MGRETDAVDQVVADWRAARPDLDPAPLELVGRVLVLAQHLERSVETALKDHDLSLGQFDILATLRRQPNGDGMTPTQLLKNVVLSSGGMTSRLDKLADRGLIARRPDPTDRRGVIVALTAKGRRLIDAATDTRFREAARSQPPTSAGERKQLAAMLRVWLAAVEVE